MLKDLAEGTPLEELCTTLKRIEADHMKLMARCSELAAMNVHLEHERDAAREDAKRLDALDYDKDGNSIGYICVFPDRNRALFAPQHGRNVREVIDEARAARKATP